MPITARVYAPVRQAHVQSRPKAHEPVPPQAAEPKMMLLGWDVVDRATDTVDEFVALSDDQRHQPGYVEAVERGYETSQWTLERVYLITDRQ